MMTPEHTEKAMQALARLEPLIEGAMAFDGVPPSAVMHHLYEAIGHINAAHTAAEPYEAWKRKPTKRRGA